MITLQKKLTSKKVFSYSKRNVSLNFELNENTKTIKDFLRLLEEAIKDVKSLLDK